MYKKKMFILFFLSLLLPPVLLAAPLDRYSVPEQRYSAPEQRYSAPQKQRVTKTLIGGVSQEVYIEFKTNIEDKGDIELKNIETEIKAAKGDCPEDSDKSKYYDELLQIIAEKRNK